MTATNPIQNVHMRLRRSSSSILYFKTLGICCSLHLNDFICYFLKDFIHILSCLGAGLHIVHSMIFCKSLCFLCVNLSIRNINFVTYEKKKAVFFVGRELFDPVFSSFHWFIRCNVIGDHSSISIFVIERNQSSKPLLTTCIPYV